jgi:cytochrome P450
MKTPNGSQSPAAVQMYNWMTNPLAYMNNCVKQYGDPFIARWVNVPPLVFFSNPKAIEEILTADSKLFDCGVGNALFAPLVGEASILLADGSSHKRKKRLLMPSFHGERMRTYGKLICDIAQEVTSDWAFKNSFYPLQSTQEITLKVVLHAVFGINSGTRYKKLIILLSSLLDYTASLSGSAVLYFQPLQKDLGAWSPWGKFKRWRAAIDELLYAEIKERKSNPDVNNQDILSLLIAARDEDGQALSDKELHDELLGLLVAAYETTSLAIAWALYWIHSNIEVKEKLLEELKTLKGLDAAEITTLPYLNAVCCETLRIYPSVLIAFSRIPKAPFKVLDYEFEPGVQLVASIYLTHNRPDIYPEPNKFEPERFLERQYSPYEYLPFGGSNRRCIGAALAMYEMKLALATILTKFDLELINPEKVRAVRRAVTVLAPANLRMLVKKTKD